MLSSHDPPVILAKMDTTIPENAELARNYTHNGVPSIKIFRNGGKTVHDYKGTRETDGIISYLKKHAGPASLEIKSKEDAASLIDEKKIVVVSIGILFIQVMFICLITSLWVKNTAPCCYFRLAYFQNSA